ncbi:cytochrome P450 [Coprinopsis sp. MPI-PUGE-AT-0042]|nr:cytochrome P450 [Coprinopsis sp. MPI-PUGE-AT-0042]
MSLPVPFGQVVQAIGACGVAYVLSALIKHALAKDPYGTLPAPEGGSWLLGHLPYVMGKESLTFQEDLVEKESSLAVRFGMFLGGSTILLADPKALYHVLIKDHHKFEEQSEILAVNTVVFGDGLISTHGEQHRRQRKTLVPVFSIKHMRGMVPVFDEITQKLAGTISRLVSDGQKEVEVFEWVTRTALELIGQGGFGYSFDPLTEDVKEHPFVTSVKLLVPLSMQKTFLAWVIILPPVQKWNLGGKRLRRFVAENLTWGSYRKMVDVVNVLHSTSVQIFESRKKALSSQNEHMRDGDEEAGKDVLTILMQANMSSNAGDRLLDEEILAQINTFTFAGMDTTTSAASRLLWLLSEHQDVQDRLRVEIRDAKRKYGRPNYDELVGLPYMDAVCRETLRLHPPLPMMSREVKEDTILPLLKPIRGTDGKDITELFVRKGLTIFISIIGWNRNRDVWGLDALEWKPERWLNDLPRAVTDAKVPGVYSNLMTFLGGSRGCIGFKFAQLELKMLLFNLLDQLKFSPSKKEMFWRGSIVTPAIDLAKIRPELPLVVERVGEAVTDSDEVR